MTCLPPQMDVLPRNRKLEIATTIGMQLCGLRLYAQCGEFRCQLALKGDNCSPRAMEERYTSVSIPDVSFGGASSKLPDTRSSHVSYSRTCCASRRSR